MQYSNNYIIAFAWLSNSQLPFCQ